MLGLETVLKALAGGAWFGRSCAGCDGRLAIGESALWCVACGDAIVPAFDSRRLVPERMDTGLTDTGLTVHARWMYGGPVRDAVVAAKGRGGAGATSLIADAVRVLSHRVGALSDSSATQRAVLIPVPPHRARFRQRLGHLPDRFAAALHRSGVGGFALDALRRTDDLPTRRRGLKAQPTFVPGAVKERRRAILVDDVVTTGATLLAAATCATEAGWDVVAAVCLADARPHGERNASPQPPLRGGISLPSTGRFPYNETPSRPSMRSRRASRGRRRRG